MGQVINYSGEERGIYHYAENLLLGLGVYRGFILNLFNVKAPLFCGHKVTYNCNLRCKMCQFWKRSPDASLEQEKRILTRVYDSGAVGIAFEGGEPLLRTDLVDILAFSRPCLCIQVS